MSPTRYLHRPHCEICVSVTRPLALHRFLAESLVLATRANFKGACFAVTVWIEPSKFERQRNSPAGIAHLIEGARGLQTGDDNEEACGSGRYRCRPCFRGVRRGADEADGCGHRERYDLALLAEPCWPAPARPVKISASTLSSSEHNPKTTQAAKSPFSRRPLHQPPRRSSSRPHNLPRSESRSMKPPRKSRSSASSPRPIPRP